jgi:hypothetical protein
VRSGAASTLFPFENWISFWKDFSCISEFSRWWNAFVPNRPIHLVEETHVSLQRKPCVLEGGQIAHCFPLRIELVFKGVLTAYQNYQGGERLILFQIGLFC